MVAGWGKIRHFGVEYSVLLLTTWLWTGTREGNSIGVSEDQGYAPTWAPDSTKIAFVKRIEATARLATIHIDSSDYAIISADDELFVDAPQWSPDGSRIAYLVQGIYSCKLRVLNLDTSTHHRKSHRMAAPGGDDMAARVQPIDLLGHRCRPSIGSRILLL